MSKALIPSDAQLATLARWVEEKLPTLGTIQCFERLASPRRAERIAFVRVHGSNGQVDVAAKRPMRWSKIDEGDVELAHLQRFRAAGMNATPLPLGYDVAGGLLWTVVLPGVPLQHWLFHHLRSPSRRWERRVYAAMRSVGRWLAREKSLPFDGTLCKAHPFRSDPEHDVVASLEAGLLEEDEAIILREALAWAPYWTRSELTLVWLHGDFGPGNCLVHVSAGRAHVGILDFANSFVGRAAFDCATFTAGIAVGAALRYVSRDRIVLARSAFADGYFAGKRAQEGAFHSGPTDEERAEHALQECAATLLSMSRYASRVLHAPPPFRAALRQHVRHAATHRVLALAREAIARHEMLEGRSPVALPVDERIAAAR
jgi:hypothetical protein